jgi:predicted metal-dependent hydrolase
MKQLMINDIMIEIERKRIKNMYLKVLPPEGRVRISAPIRMSDEAVRQFVLTKIDWIKNQQDKIKKRQIIVDMQYVSGDQIPFMGKRYTLIIEDSGLKESILPEGDRIILKIRSDSSPKHRKQMIDNLYRQVLKSEIPKLIEKWEKVIGVKSEGFRIRDMKTRWGTCNIRTKIICLNLQLAKKQSVCLEYVIVHELVHLLEGSHNYIFKGYMDRFLPGWRSIKKEMNGSV